MTRQILAARAFAHLRHRIATKEPRSSDEFRALVSSNYQNGTTREQMQSGGPMEAAMLALQVYVQSQLGQVELQRIHERGAMSFAQQRSLTSRTAAQNAATTGRNIMRSEVQSTGSERDHARRTGLVLWGVQGLLALVFLSAGAMKLTMPAAELTRQIGMPAAFLRFIGVCELLGGLGLLLPGLTRIATQLTPLAATGLVIIMVGATVVTLAQGTIASALVPFVVGLLAASVAYGRQRLVPLQGRRAAGARSERNASRGLQLRAS